MRYACCVEYTGEGFFGFQTQIQEPTIQNSLEKAIEEIANHTVRITCCGRTDTGVNATAQVIHFDSKSIRSEYQWIMGINSNLPHGISVMWVKSVSKDFHARFSAIERSYRFRILNRWIRPAISRFEYTWEMNPLDEGKMHIAAQCLVGEHDFNAFRSSSCQSKVSVKTMYTVSVTRNKNIVELNISGSGFLHHMIRNIVGTLLPIGQGKKSIDFMAQVLESKDRTKAGVTAKPQGLTFTGVKYPKEFNLPMGSGQDFRSLD